MISNDNPNYRWVILGLLIVAQFFLSVVAFGWGALAPFLKELMSLNATRVGLISSSFFIAAGVSSFPGGIFADRNGEKKGLLVSFGLCGSALMCLGFVHSEYTLFLIMIAISGLGYGVNNPSAAKALLIWFDQKSRGTVFGIRQAGITMGGAAASIFLVYICQKIGPIMSMQMVGLSIMVMFIVCFFFYQTPKIEQNPPTNIAQEKVQKREPRSERGYINKPLAVLLVIIAVLGLTQGIVITFFLLYLKESLGHSMSSAGFLLCILMVSGSVGRILWGVVSDRMLNGARQPVLVIIFAMIALDVMVLALWSPAWPNFLFFPVVIALGISSLGWSGIITVLLAELSGHSRAATLVGLAAAIGWCGMFIGPLGFGIITDHIGYSYAWMSLAAVSLFSFFLCFLLPVSKPADEHTV